MNAKVALIVLDGWGFRKELKDNAIEAAKKPCFDRLFAEHAHTFLEASGEAVGLPVGQMGNSEVGHTTIGAGTILDTDLVRITKAVRGNQFKDIPAIKEAFQHVNIRGSVLHLMGLLGDGGVHAHSSHLYALLRAAKEAGVARVAVHGFTDGRDTAPQSGARFVEELEAVVSEVGNATIATLSGRYFAMDRDNNWDRLLKAEGVLFGEEGEIISGAPSSYLKQQYSKDIVDEQLPPVSFARMPVSSHDAVIMYNYRPDRARMLAKKISDFVLANDGYLATMTEYDASIPAHIIFGAKTIETTLAKELSLAHKSQAHIAETEKYAHATYFLNGGVEGVYEGEEHVLIASRKDVATHDEAPEMRASEIADATIAFMEKGTDFLFINFANPDMLGHTGNVPAIISGIETVDAQLSRIESAAKKHDYVLLITADHGNAELNKDQETGVVHTAHTTNVVPCIITDLESRELQPGGLADIAPTVLAIMGVPKPAAMTGKSLI